MSWHQFDRHLEDETPTVNEAIDAHEKQALDAIHALVRLAAKHPTQAVPVAQALSKIWTISQSKTQTIKRAESARVTL